MGYSYFDPAGQGLYPNFVFGEIPGGSINGVNKIFTLAKVPYTGAAVKLYRNGLYQTQGKDYTISGQTITYLTTTPQVPLIGDSLIADYLSVNITGTIPATNWFKDQEIPISSSGYIDGTTAIYTIKEIANPGTSLRVFRNGLRQILGTDYTYDGLYTITFAAFVPQPTDIITVFYFKPGSNSVGGSNFPPTFANSITPSGALNSSNEIYTLNQQVDNLVFLELYYNGVLLSLYIDYTLSVIYNSSPITYGTQIILSSINSPMSGIILLPLPLLQLSCRRYR